MGLTAGGLPYLILAGYIGSRNGHFFQKWEWALVQTWGPRTVWFQLDLKVERMLLLTPFQSLTLTVAISVEAPSLGIYTAVQRKCISPLFYMLLVCTDIKVRTEPASDPCLLRYQRKVEWRERNANESPKVFDVPLFVGGVRCYLAHFFLRVTWGAFPVEK